MVEDGSDHTLLELAKHLGFELTKPVGSIIEPLFWRRSMFRLFISHLAMHKAWVSELQEALQCFGITSFVAHKDISPTSEWQNEIELALSTCDALVALLHPEFHSSNWTDQEIGFAMGRGVPVYSVRLGQDPYGSLVGSKLLTELALTRLRYPETYSVLIERTSRRKQKWETL